MKKYGYSTRYREGGSLFTPGWELLITCSRPHHYGSHTRHGARTVWKQYLRLPQRGLYETRAAAAKAGRALVKMANDSLLIDPNYAFPHCFPHTTR